MADESIASLMDITGVGEEVARGLLQISNNDMMQACSLYFDNPEIVNSLPASRSQAAGRAPRQMGARGREDAQGVIHIDDSSDDNDDDDGGDVRMGGTPAPTTAAQRHHDDDDDDLETSAAVAAALSAQEDEDAAMARRLQEEFYGGGAGAGAAGGGVGGLDDEVRAPIARTTETLVAPDIGGLSGGMFGPGGDDDDDDGQAAAEAFLEESRRRRREQQATGAYRASRSTALNPFAQSVWGDGLQSRAGAAGGEQSATSRRLAELYRPPREILTHLDWDDTREEGKDQKKWIMVNLQNMSDFRCQMLNRDVWKDEDVQEVIRERFLFLQYDKDALNARHYIQLYLPNDQHLIMSNYPHIAVVDPRTGEQIKLWSGIDCPTTAVEFMMQLQEFLERYRFSGKNPVATTKARKSATKDVDRMTEDEMLQLAMQNSLETANGSLPVMPERPSVQDPDELTRLGGKGKGKAKDEQEGRQDQGMRMTQAEMEKEKEKEEEEGEEGEEKNKKEQEEKKEDSAFSRIPSDRPHTEPAAGGAGITRIQFMSPGGKVVRRFAVTDPVQRLYEWLKAEPLGGEDKAGVEFEIKRVPQGTDLISDLDKTIEEAGIKQSSLAVEFLG